MLEKHKKKMRCSLALLNTIILLIIVMWAVHTTFIYLQISSFGNDKDCAIDKYWAQRSTQEIDLVYHCLRSVLLLLINFVLIKSTWQTHMLIRKHSDSRLFKKELRNIWLVYWSFIVCYAGWLVLYIYQFLHNRLSDDKSPTEE